MKLEFEKNEIESTGTLNSDNFSIGDTGFVLEILRSKLYSNIKKAVCQEYACNARDAHREAGKPEVPIKITLPNALDPNWRCRDYGFGISPDRMSKVFVKFGVSTKRGDNVQTGGMGIGAKSALGYGDSFIINTFIDGVVRSYMAVIDDSRCGKLVLMSETTTTEPSGTEIVVPVRTGDYWEFIQETRRAVRHWDVKPIIQGASLTFDDFKPSNILLSGTGWFSMSRDNSPSGGTFLVVDGIEYPMPLDFLGQPSPVNFDHHAYGTSLFLSFPTGVLSMSANREQIERDARSRKAVLEKLLEVKSELVVRFQEAVAAADTFIKANIVYATVARTLGITAPKDMTWRGTPLVGTTVRIPEIQYMSYSSARGNKTGVRKEFGCLQSGVINLQERVIYCLIDQEFNTSAERCAAALFDKFSGTSMVVMIRGLTPGLIKKHNLGLINFEKFEDHYKAVNRKASLGRLIFFKLGQSYDNFVRSSLSEFEADTNEIKLWCHLTKIGKNDIAGWCSNPSSNGLYAVFGGHRTFDNSGLSEMIRTIANKSKGKSSNGTIDGISVYGFQEEIPADKIASATDGMKNLYDYVSEFIEENKICLQEVRYACGSTEMKKNGLLFTADEVEHFLTRCAKIEHHDSLFVQYLKVADAYNKKRKFLSRFSFIVNKTEDQKAMSFSAAVLAKSQEFMKQYPMLYPVSYNQSSTYGGDSRDSEPKVDIVLDYVNAMDLLVKINSKIKSLVSESPPANATATV